MLVEDLYGQEIDLERYAYFSEKQIMALLTNAEIFESQTIKKGGFKFQMQQVLEFSQGRNKA